MGKCIICGEKNKKLVVCKKCYGYKPPMGRPKKYGEFSLKEIATATGVKLTNVWNYFNGITIDGSKKKKIEGFLKEKEGKKE